MAGNALGIQMSDIGGEQGLVLAIIATAVRDAVSAQDEMRTDAWRYFASDLYREHLAYLDLPLMLPQPLHKAPAGRCLQILWDVEINEITRSEQ